MASRRQSYALASFVSDVLLPLRERVRQPWRGAQWERVWSHAEGVEASRFLEIGRALGAFDADEMVAVRDGFHQVLDDSLHESEVSELLGPERVLSLFHLDRSVELATVRVEGLMDQRDVARARGLWQSNVLVSTRLGHGLAAEGLARLAFGDAGHCLELLADVSSRVRFSPRDEETLLRLMRQPAGAIAGDGSRTGGLELVASMFHAVQYLWSLGFSHEHRDIDLAEGGFRVDPLARATGTSTGDYLHMVQYWRAAFHDQRLEQDFFTALEMAGTVWFKMGLIDRKEVADGDMAAFLRDLTFRATRAVNVWCRAFDSQLVGTAEGGQSGAAAV